MQSGITVLKENAARKAGAMGKKKAIKEMLIWTKRGVFKIR